jgi:hypothetical protein
MSTEKTNKNDGTVTPEVTNKKWYAVSYKVLVSQDVQANSKEEALEIGNEYQPRKDCLLSASKGYSWNTTELSELEAVELSAEDCALLNE